MRNRDIPRKLWIRLLGVCQLPCTYGYSYLGHATKCKEGYLDLGTSDPKDTRKLRVSMSKITLRGSSGRKHTYHIGWLPVEFAHPTVYWGIGK